MKTRHLIFFTAILSGCMVGPNYQPPEVVVSAAWEGESTDIDLVLSSKDVAQEWWKIFNDPLLTAYIEQAAQYNFDVLTAEANILQARALKKVAASDLFPHINADFNATKTYFSKNGPVFAIQAPTPTTPLTTIGPSALPFAVQIPQVQNLYNALLDATWEIDLFGKTRRGVEATEARIGSATEARSDTLISVYAEIAMNYIQLRSTQQQALLVEQNIELLEQSQDVVQKRVETGYSNDLDLLTIQSQLSTAKAEFPLLIARIYQNIYTLSILTGKVPEALVEELMPIAPLPELPQEVALGLRSDLLRRRPDVRQRERDLAAATAMVGVAVASFYPSFSLGGDGGLQSLALSDLFQWSSRTWAFGGDFNIPLFQGGRLTGTLRASQAAESAAAYTYHQTILKALQETEGALVAYGEDVAASRELTKNKEYNARLLELTDQRYVRGLINVLDLISSQQKLITAEETLLASDTAALLHLITLYKALGGGWDTSQICNP